MNVTILHSCGHVVEWEGPTEVVTHLLSTFPCPWCGGETGEEKLDSSVTEVVFYNTPDNVVEYVAHRTAPDDSSVQA